MFESKVQGNEMSVLITSVKVVLSVKDLTQ